MDVIAKTLKNFKHDHAAHQIKFIAMSTKRNENITTSPIIGAILKLAITEFIKEWEKTGKLIFHIEQRNKIVVHEKA